MTNAFKLRNMNDPITSFIAENRQLAEAATPGPWIPSVMGARILTGDQWESVCTMFPSSDYRMASWEDGRGPKSETANCDFIAASRTSLPTALDALEIAVKALELITALPTDHTAHPNQLSAVTHATDGLDAIRETLAKGDA